MKPKKNSHRLAAEQLAQTGARVRLVREAFGMKLREFSRAIEAGHGNVSSVEEGARDLPRDMALSIAIRFGAGMDYLFLGDLVALKPEARAKIEAYLARNTD